MSVRVSLLQSDLFFKIGSLALRQLIYSILRAETPTTHHDTIFLHLLPIQIIS